MSILRDWRRDRLAGRGLKRHASREEILAWLNHYREPPWVQPVPPHLRGESVADLRARLGMGPLCSDDRDAYETALARLEASR